MLLRLIDSPRYTIDIDYTFIPYASKKDIIEPLVKFLSLQKEIDDVSYSLNSKCLRIDIKSAEHSSVIKINVDKECPYSAISAGSVARSLGLTGRVIKAMDFSYSMSNKIAAYLERNLMRDLYDCYFFHTLLKISPDYEQLKKRLLDIRYTKNNGRKKSMTMKEFSVYIVSQSEKMTEDKIKELEALLGKDEIEGLYLKLRKSMIQIADKIEKYEDGKNN